MNDRNFDQLLAAWIEDGPKVAPDRVSAEARREISRTRQSVALGPWLARRFADMSAFAKFGVAMVILAVVTFVGISLLSGPSPGLPGPTPTPSTGAVTNNPTPPSSDLGIAAIDAICRDSISRDLSPPIVADQRGDLVATLYVSAEGELLCAYQPSYGDGAVVQGGSEHLADRVSAETPLVIGPNQPWTEGSGTYVWGAVGPEVAKVVIDIEGAPGPYHAQLIAGYFVRVLASELPCCVFTTIALDANNQELARESAPAVAWTYECRGPDATGSPGPLDLVWVWVLSEDATLTITDPADSVFEGTWSADGNSGEITMDGVATPFSIEGDRLVSELGDCIRAE